MSLFETVVVMPSTKGRSGKETLEIIQWLINQGLKVVLPEGKSEELEIDNLDVAVEEIRKTADIMISLGGDGTLLRACAVTAGTDIPVLGINLGHLGFLTEATLGDWQDTLNRTLSGHFEIQERMMVECHVYRNGQAIFGGTALNDVVIGNGVEMQLIKLSLKINGQYAGSYSADGVIIATPMGSTAYSLSAGGPIVNPGVECMIITAICPHTLSARPLVIPSGEIIQMRERSGKSCMVCLDGHTVFKVLSDDIIKVKKCSSYARFIHVGKEFYTTIREKLNWFG